jgi:hypothetical protein
MSKGYVYTSNRFSLGIYLHYLIDIIFAMVKEETAGSAIFMNLTIQTTTF